MRALLLILMLSISSQAHAGEVRVAVAANFSDAMQALTPIFENSSGNRLVITYGSTGKLYAQISHGAPFELLLSADSVRAQKAEMEGLAVVGSRFTYAIGKLYLIACSDSAIHDAEAWLRSGRFEHLAIANPKTAPYGLAAREALEQMGLWETYETRVVRGESVAQTFQFIATKNAQGGFVAASQLRGVAAGCSEWEVPQSFYHPIEQQAILLNRGSSNVAAVAFLDFLKSDVARNIISGFGYRLE